MDRLSPERRSALMAKVRSRDTGPERAVRSLAHRLGYRFRLCQAGLPGRPDLVFAGRGKVVFVHGCFWHCHPGCRANRTPATRPEYWHAKLANNVRRDRRNIARLRRLGWGVMVVWECQLRTPDRVAARLARFLG
jgi:DNA mismatch endonuclease, patch repair protein